jgi:hypothetical protein
MMASVRYFVFHRGNDWLVTLDGAQLARHGSRPEALRGAIVMADLMGAMHHDADVMVEEDGELAVHWTHGVDPLPQMPMADTWQRPVAPPVAGTSAI